MATPKAKEARRYYRVAIQRRDEAQLLFEKLGLSAAAVYLSGYAVECVLKAAILANSREADHDRILGEEFRGARAHNIAWLRERLAQTASAAFPGAISRDLTFLSTWSVDPPLYSRCGRPRRRSGVFGRRG